MAASTSGGIAGGEVDTERSDRVIGLGTVFTSAHIYPK